MLPVMMYGLKTLTLTKNSTHHLGVWQHKIERTMAGVTLRDRIINCQWSGTNSKDQMTMG